MIPLGLGLNSEPVKYGLVIALAPYWLPFFRSLWRSLNDSLRDEGGLFGRAPTDEQLREIEKVHGFAADDLSSTPKRFAGDEARAQRARTSTGRASSGRRPSRGF